LELLINEVLDFQTVPSSVLNENLRKFYAKAQPENRAKKMSDDQATEYHKNSMRNVRSALNRHMKDIGRLVDIVKDNDFKTSNAILVIFRKIFIDLRKLNIWNDGVVFGGS
jgi:glucuronate isomerase